MIQLDPSETKRGKVYVRANVLLEVDLDTGVSKTLEFNCYPAKHDDWQYVRHRKKQDTKKQKELPEIQNIDKEEVLF